MSAEGINASIRKSENPVSTVLLVLRAVLTVAGVLVGLVGILAWSWLQGYHFSGDYQCPRFQNPRTNRRDRVAPGEVIAPVFVVAVAVLLGWLAAAIVALPALMFLGWSMHDRLRIKGSSELKVAGDLLHRVRNSELLWSAAYLAVLSITGLIDRVASLYDRIRS